MVRLSDMFVLTFACPENQRYFSAKFGTFHLRNNIIKLLEYV